MFESKIENIFTTPSNRNFFFGYYDKLQFNESNCKLLAIETFFKGRNPVINDFIKIGYFDLNNNNEFISIDETNVFNWQQGNMLSWLNQNSIIYNTIFEDKYVTCIYDILTQKNLT